MERSRRSAFKCGGPGLARSVSTALLVRGGFTAGVFGRRLTRFGFAHLVQLFLRLQGLLGEEGTGEGVGVEPIEIDPFDDNCEEESDSGASPGLARGLGVCRPEVAGEHDRDQQGYLDLGRLQMTHVLRVAVDHREPDDDQRNELRASGSLWWLIRGEELVGAEGWSRHGGDYSMEGGAGSSSVWGSDSVAFFTTRGEVLACCSVG